MAARGRDLLERLEVRHRRHGDRHRLALPSISAGSANARTPCRAAISAARAASRS
jgi:hypothetical protein